MSSQRDVLPSQHLHNAAYNFSILVHSQEFGVISRLVEIDYVGFGGCESLQPTCSQLGIWSYFEPSGNRLCGMLKVRVASAHLFTGMNLVLKECILSAVGLGYIGLRRCGYIQDTFSALGIQNKGVWVLRG